MTHRLTKLLAPLACLAPFASASLSNGFAAFGNTFLNLNSNVVISEGLVGSNLGLVTVSGGVTMNGAQGGAGFNSGSSDAITGNLIFSGNIDLGGSTNLFGNADSGGNILLHTDTIIHGNATAAGSITVGGGSSAITGTSTPFGSPAAFSAVVMPSAYSFTGGGANQTIAGGGTLTLAPGTYGALSSGTNATLNLSSGTYIFDSISLGGSNQINYTISGGGAIHILVVGNVSTGTSLITHLNGQTFANADPTLIPKIYAESHGTWLLGGGGQWLGEIYTPFANLTFNSNVDLRGQVLSGAGLTLGGGDHVINLIPSTEFATPEPASLILVATGILCGWLLRRRRSASSRTGG